MAAPLLTETNLIGYLNRGITSTETSIEVKFYDKVTGEARTPSATTLLFVIDKGSQDQPNPNYEIILATSHTTSAGVTTLASVTRGLAFSGNSLGAVTANKKGHVANAEVGCVDVHYLWTLSNAKIAGLEDFDTDITIGDGVKLQFGDTVAYITTDDTGTNLKFKDASNSEITLTQLAAAAGVDEKTKISAADTTSGYLDTKLTAGDGLAKTITTPGGDERLDLDVDLTDTTTFKAVSAGAGDAGKAVLFDSDGYVDKDSVQILKDNTATGAELSKLAGTSANVTAANLNSLTAGSAITGLHSHSMKNGVGTKSVAATSDTLNITHGLGTTPNWVRIIANTTGNKATGVGISVSNGLKNGSTYSTEYHFIETATPTSSYGVANNAIIYLQCINSGSKTVSATATLTSTEIQLTFSNSDSTATSIGYTWECGL